MLLMAINLAIGIFLGSYCPLSLAASGCLLFSAPLFLYAFYISRRGWVALSSFCLFICLVGFVRVQMGDLQLLPYSLITWSGSLVQSALSMIHSLGLNQETTSLLSAMLLGYRPSLSPEIVDLYRQTGASHILALSGMHVSILFALFNMVLMRTLQFRLRYVVGVVELVLMWGYALLVGFPISLCRASLMVTFFLIGQMRLVGHSGEHTLGLAAFLLLMVSPLSLYDVGFQLSFMAMAGILFYYAPLTRVAKPKHWLAQWGLKAFLLSLSAQLFTLPLLLYYFHFYSFASFLFSPIYILITTAIIYFSLLFLILSPWYISHILAFSVEGLVYIQHKMMSVVSCIPFDRVEDIHISIRHIVLCYAALFCLIPTLHALRKPDVQLPQVRWVMFLRSWPYWLATFLLLLTAFILP